MERDYYVEKVRALKAERDRLKVQRDKLLAAAKSMLFYIDSFKDETETVSCHEFYRRVEAALPSYRAAIARAKGE